MLTEIKRVGRKTNESKGISKKFTTTTVVLPEHKKVIINAYGSMANGIETLAKLTACNDNLPLITK
jgi:hypothetical protein